MSLIDSIPLLLIMVTLAAIPSASVVLVVTRSATFGIANGIAVSLGILLGDLVFIFLAILGLSVVAETMGGLFLIIKYMGGLYLLWVGFSLLTSANKVVISLDKANSKGNLASSFVAGFFLTLGDIKAIYFYISLFPAFIDLTTINVFDILTIICITIVSVGGIKIAYAVSAIKVMKMSRGLGFEYGAKKTTGCFMVGVGSYLIIKT